MSVKANLRIVLKADETIVAESDDAALWQRVLFAVNKGAKGPQQRSDLELLDDPLTTEGSEQEKACVQDPLSRFADDLRVERPVIEAASDPSIEPPYLHLNEHHWEALKRNTPGKGPGSVSPMKLAATLLALWFRHAKLGNPTQAQALAVLATIGLEDKNPSRAIHSTEWLQARTGGTIVLNPAQISQALDLAKAYFVRKQIEDSSRVE